MSGINDNFSPLLHTFVTDSDNLHGFTLIYLYSLKLYFNTSINIKIAKISNSILSASDLSLFSSTRV